MEESLVGFLLADAGLVALVGNRVNWDERPQAQALPAVTLSRIGGTPGYTLEGATTQVESRVQIDCWAGKKSDALAVSRQIETLLSGYRGAMGDITVQGSFKDSEDSGFETGAANARIFRTRMDFIIFHHG